MAAKGRYSRIASAQDHRDKTRRVEIFPPIRSNRQRFAVCSGSEGGFPPCPHVVGVPLVDGLVDPFPVLAGVKKA